MNNNTKDTYKILLIEDHPDIATMYQVTFDSKVPGALSIAYNKKDGIEKINEITPDLVLLDLIIPEAEGEGIKPVSRHGFELLKELRSAPKTKKLKVIVLTNIESTADRKEAKKLGALEYIVKSHTLPREVLDISLSYLEN